MSLVLPKGTKLYRVGGELVSEQQQTPFFHLVFHPSEACWSEDSIISVYEIKRPVHIRWCIGRFMHTRLFSGGDLSCLKEETMDGCLVPSHDKSSVQCIIRSNVVALVESAPIQIDWSPQTFRGETMVPKCWGSVYPFGFVDVVHGELIQITLHFSFERKIKTYCSFMDQEDPGGSACWHLLQRASIQYVQ